MFLRKIEIKDWKAYVNTRFDFPRPGSTSNVVLIGAKNGYGKTSLFEAIVLGLFGRDGLPLIARAPFGASADDRLQFSYNAFLAETLHRNALREGRHSASVELSFEEDDGGPLIIRRIWNFAPDGRHKPEDEEVRIYVGKNERPTGSPPGEDPVEWRRTFVARKFLPHTLAPFFLFDGEQVQTLAQRDMSAQVRTGIEGLLGIQVLRELVGDLRKYAENRRYSVGGAASSKTMDRIRIELATLEHENGEAEARLQEVRAELDLVLARRDLLTRELSSMGAGSGDASLKDRFEELNRVKRAIEELNAKLQTSVVTGVSLALAGRQIRQTALHHLGAEAIREEWEAGLQQGEKGFGRFLAALSASIASTLQPPLTREQHDELMRLVRASWQELWYPPPDGCADSYLHDYLRGAERSRVTQRLGELTQLSTTPVADLIDQIANFESDRHKIEGEIAELEGIGPQLEAKVTELREVASRADLLTSQKGKLERELEGLTGQLNQKRQELARVSQSLTRAGPNLRRADGADRIANTIEAIIKDAVPQEIHRSMAHKSIVERVSIEPDCTVQLLSSRGKNVRDLVFSAGEQQVFAQALISAVVEVSQRDFPMVIDTPLARLDDAHREGVLTYFTDRVGQVILLSTDTEVVGRYLDLVKPRLSATYHIVHEHDGDIGRSKPTAGYFPETRL
jgi:DNA sulfur modification protein DndD